MNTKNLEENQDLKEIEEMYKAGVHFGYSRSSSHPKMKPYFFGLRNNTEIFNLEKVYTLLRKAEDFLKNLSSEEKKILLVSTKPEVKDFIEKASRELEMPYVTDRWLGGTLTNFDIIKIRIGDFKELDRKKTARLAEDKSRQAGEFSSLSKKEISRLDKKLAKMEKHLGGLRSLVDKPAALLVVDPKEEKSAVEEARKMEVPIIAILNSDCDPSNIDFPIPANDVSSASVQYLLDRLTKAYKDGSKKT